MTNDSSRCDRCDLPAGVATAAISLFALVAQSLALTTARFQATLNSDYLLAHIFSRELFVTPYPVSGWKFGMGSFAFPDYALYLPWFAIFGDTGFSYAAYAATLWCAYFAAFAWALRAAGAGRLASLTASGVALNLLLATRLLPGAYADRLWQLSIPAYHGGNLLLELCVFALIFGAVRTGRWPRASLWILGAVTALGVFSNAQLLLHVLLPVGGLLWFAARKKLFPENLFSKYLRVVGLGVGVAIAMRAALSVAEVFFFASLFKEWPLPWLIWAKLLKFIGDFRTELFAETPAIWCVAAGAVVVGLVMLARARRDRDAVKAFVPAAVLLTLVAILATPIAAVYWKNSGSARYLLPWFVLPSWLLAHVALRVSGGLRPVLGFAGVVVIAVAGVVAVPQARRSAMEFPRPPEALSLRDWLRANNLRSGLCHFWENHLLQTEWGYDGPRLSNIRDKDFCEFWCNNAFAYFPLRDGAYAHPEVDFVILNHLDVGILRERLGGDFTPVQVGPYAVVKLSPEQARRASELVETLSLRFLAGRRAARVKNSPSFRAP